MSAYIPAALRRRVRERFADRCAYCHTAEALSVATFEVEHIVPRSSGGETVFENLCLACPSCNRHKADRTTAIDSDSASSVPLFSPHRDQWENHFAWNDDATEIIALTASGRATLAALRMNRSQLIRMRHMWVAMGVHPPILD